MLSPSKEEIHCAIFYECRWNNNANGAKNFIKSKYGDGVVYARKCRRYFFHFRNRGFILKYEPRKACLREYESKVLETTNTVREMSGNFKIIPMTVNQKIKRLGKVLSVGKLIQHDLSAKNHNVLIIVQYCLHISFKHHFWIELLRGIRSGYFITMLSKGISKLVVVENLLSSQKWACIQRIFFWVCSGISTTHSEKYSYHKQFLAYCKELFIMSC